MPLLASLAVWMAIDLAPCTTREWSVMQYHVYATLWSVCTIIVYLSVLFTVYCFLSITKAFCLRDAMLARVFAIVTCPSVCLSITRRYCVKTKKARVMISSLSGIPTILVFWRQISSQNSKGFPRAGPQQGWGEKIQPFSSFKHQHLENGSRYGQSYH